MGEMCAKIHHALRSLPIHRFDFGKRSVPLNGIYILFEKNELGHDGNRIVRIGTHRGEDQLRSRLNEHFVKENKDRSIFRKNIGRALLRRDADGFLEQWELDLTTLAARAKFGAAVNLVRQSEVERQVTTYIQSRFSFAAFRVDSKEERLSIESSIISTVSWCDQCKPSRKWLGLYSPKPKIRESGLWLEQGLYGSTISKDDFSALQKLINSSQAG